MMPKIKKTNTYKKQKLIKLDNISGKTKKFDPNLHNKYDIKARDIIKNRFPENAFDNENIYGEDLVFKCDNLPYNFIEVQVCSHWDSDIFPYVYPFIYARKMKFSKKTLFIMFNKDYTKVIFFSKKAINATPTRLKKYDREMIHYVPWNKAMMIDTENLTLNAIRSYTGNEIIEIDDTNKIDTEDSD